ncbi:hypothetical protein AGLY_005284 [Aphis glycines]|uniref:Uncharacterized protein n=1 Tax=Aphis glycines TaxID=307491 RepID=A0A6G0TWD0_APHGL|nr:hypothetical protein AGLY_005284 [Aphis glycines]
MLSGGKGCTKSEELKDKYTYCKYTGAQVALVVLIQYLFRRMVDFKFTRGVMNRESHIEFLNLYYILPNCKVTQIECVQHRFMKMISLSMGINHKPHDYTPVLMTFNLSTLNKRRDEDDITFLNGLVSGIIDSPCLLSTIGLYIQGITYSRDPYYSAPVTRNYLDNDPLRRAMCFNNQYGYNGSLIRLTLLYYSTPTAQKSAATNTASCFEPNSNNLGYFVHVLILTLLLKK